jgi:hypothetical protein
VEDTRLLTVVDARTSTQEKEDVEEVVVALGLDNLLLHPIQMVTKVENHPTNRDPSNLVPENATFQCLPRFWKMPCFTLLYVSKSPHSGKNRV